MPRPVGEDTDRDVVVLELVRSIGPAMAEELVDCLRANCPVLTFRALRHRFANCSAIYVGASPEFGAEVGSGQVDRLGALRDVLDGVSSGPGGTLVLGAETPDADGSATAAIAIPPNTAIGNTRGHAPLPQSPLAVPFLRSARLLLSSPFPLHHRPQLLQLRHKWVLASPLEVLRPPLPTIRAYFGAEIAFYFAWLSHFAGALCAPAILGTFLFLLPDDGRSPLAFVLFAVFNSVWAIRFLRSWEQRQRELADEWDQSGGEEKRPGRAHQMKSLSVAEQRRSMLIRCTLSIPLSFLCLGALLIALFALFLLQDWTKIKFDSRLLVRVPIVLQALLILGAEAAYRQLALWLNRLEGYSSSADFEEGLVWKIALFEAASALAPLFWIAFGLKDLERLKETLATLLVTRQFVQNFYEIGIPLARGKFRLLKWLGVDRGTGRKGQLKQLLEVSPGEREAAMSEYERPLDDYMEMLVQLGYVLLFSPAFPPAALCALLNNLLELRVDAFKLCHAQQRPFGRTARDIGAWQSAFKVMCLAGVLVNWALILRFCILD